MEHSDHNTQSLDNKAETIGEVLENFDTWCLCGNDECQKYLNYAEALATIEKLLLEVIGEDDKDFPENEDKYWTYPKVRSRLRAEQRTTLKAVLYGEDE